MIIPPSTDDALFMAEALRLAARVPRRPWPNPPVGAVVVREGRIVGRGAHHGAGLPHAETLALEDAGGAARGATLYCTLEPCNHTGRTPPCAPVVAASGIARMVVALADSNPSVPGGGMSVVHAAGIHLTLGVLGLQALELIWPFVVTGAFERPFVLLKTATSLDGRFSNPVLPLSGRHEPMYLTGLEARRDVHRLRRWSDVVMVGERTVAADRPQLNGRLVREDDDCPAAEPLGAYVDTDLSFANVWPQESYYVFAGKNRAPEPTRRRIEDEGGIVVLCDEEAGHVAPESVLKAIFARGGCCVMIEGGPTLAAAFLSRGLVDRWVRYTAPIVLGGGARWPDWAGGLTSRGVDGAPRNLAAAAAEGPDAASVIGNGPAALGADEAEPVFHLTGIKQFGHDLRAVYDRLPFDQVLAELTVETVAGLHQKVGGG